MTLQKDEFLSLCMQLLTKEYGEEVSVELIHTTYWNDKAYFLRETKDSTDVICVSIDQVSSQSSIEFIQSLSEDKNDLKQVLELMLKLGHEYGVHTAS